VFLAVAGLLRVPEVGFLRTAAAAKLGRRRDVLPSELL
jgi:hypothetical protein